MRAISLDRYGPPEVLTMTEMARPRPVPTEVLVRVRAAGVNRVDAKTRAGSGIAPVLGAPPIVVGWDVSGTVEAVGLGVTLFAPGDEVYGMPLFPRQAGAYAEYVAAPSRHFAVKPAGLGHVEAASLPLAGLTAWQVLVDTAGVGPGRHVLVHAAAGGVGHLAVQIAKARGARVSGTASAAKHDFLRRIGVDQPVDYTAVPFEDVIRDVDVVVDLVGTPDTQRRSLRTLRPGGLLVGVPGGVDPAVADEAAEQGLRTTAFMVEPDHAGLVELARLAESGALTAEIADVLPLAEAPEAHRLLESHHTTGKVVLTP
ncbi:NADP-dependent oxidoreductase [Streptomyces radicis]|uniref:NADP-dependent oxidoreductase n=2 Tax=Streptomyces radicis TaxID=1750517 RepID=A0A3A9WUN4_9ACTN|nr:NADP-dependent oxidoreductase [Streptomyces radicis]RKN23474.1 NADP-dependent oxidoreductase [Streptomyces radicis]